MAYFSKDFTDFFKSLEKNNTTEWFDQHRKEYETHVKKPFAAFVQEMINRISKHEPDVRIEPKDAISRINRDTRFGADKRPYNTHLSANISAYGKKSKEYPGFYFQLSHKGIEVYGGAYMVEKENLLRIREAIVRDGAAFKKQLNDKKFKEAYGELKGEKSKMLPAELKAPAAKEELIFNKQFYYTASLDAKLITSDKLADELMKYYEAGRGVNIFLQKAMKV
jgi:uncharacterized protein (TIGR02453 family)